MFIRQNICFLKKNFEAVPPIPGNNLQADVLNIKQFENFQ